VWARLGEAVRDPIVWHDVTQLVKTVVAAVVAWVLAAEVLDLPQPFLAPWAALLVVHATVYRTVAQGARQVGATVAAVLLAATVGGLLGLDTLSVAVLLAAAMVLGRLRWLGDESTTLTTTALIVLTTGWSQDTLLFSRLFDTGIGVGVGLVVNAVLWPPLRRRAAVEAMARLDDGIGELLEDIGRRLGSGNVEEEVEGWIDRSRDLDEQVDEAWAMVRQAQESARMNPRRSARQVRDPHLWFDRLRRREQAIAEIRSMVRTLGSAVPSQAPWADPFGQVWPGLLADTGTAVAAADAGSVAAVRDRLEQLVADIGEAGTTPRWPVHGALIINLRNVLDALDEVVAAMPQRAGGQSLRSRGSTGSSP
jgi:uncharacterized membrane protein YgaE (UPF0421/DUF939 family)